MYSLFKLSINIDKTLISGVNCLQVIIISIKDCFEFDFFYDCQFSITCKSTCVAVFNTNFVCLGTKQRNIAFDKIVTFNG